MLDLHMKISYLLRGALRNLPNVLDVAFWENKPLTILAKCSIPDV